jgi:hypothetical protein
MTIRSLDAVEEAIFDRTGAPLAYITGAGLLYRFSGIPLAYLERGRVWTFPGLLVGWFAKGWLRTAAGYCVGFTAAADQQAGPSKPVLKHLPSKLQKQRPQGSGVKTPPPPQPPFSRRWCKASLNLYLTWVQLNAGQ